MPAQVNPITPQELEAKLQKYRAKALTGYDAVYDKERGLFHIAGKHPTLVGTEAVVTLDVLSFLAMLASILPTVIIPAFAQAVKMFDKAQGKLES
jgi:hypothetical protein